MARQGGGLRSYSFHEVAVAGDGVGSMVNYLESWAVVACGELRFGDCHADGVCEALSERSGGDFYPGSMPTFGMPWRLATPLAELLEVAQREVIAGQVQ